MHKKHAPIRIITALVFFTIVSIHLMVPFSTAKSVDDPYENLKTFSDVLSIIQKNYVDSVDLNEIINNSIKGMVSNLDPHSSYMPPDIYKELQVETKGSFGGLGIEITIKDGILTVVSPIEDTPAHTAGIKTGDRIIKIEGDSTKSMSLMDAVKKMRGKPKTQITITIMRDTFSEPRDFTITRDIIKIKCVKFRVIDDRFGYIRLAQFQESSAKDFKRAFDEIKSDTESLKGVILDLRGNPGGLLDQAVKISDEFLSEGLIVYTEGRLENQKMQFFANKDDQPYNYPTVVLVNGGSASASEIVAGALQDHNKAIIVGTQTFGKGTVQTIFPLNDGSGLRITTAKYYTPGHRSIQEKGITPDIIVEDNLDSFSPNSKKMKFMREKDIMKKFKNDSSDKKTPPDDSENEEGASDPDESKAADPPLQTALNILKSWEIFQNLKSDKTEAPPQQ